MRCGRRSSRSASVTGRQLAQSGPSAVRTLTGRRRPQPTQTSWLAGSVIRQYGHSGWPCSSRVAASRTAPQRAQGWARDLAAQLRQSHCPPIGRCRWMTRPQPGQAGRVIVHAPASQSGRSAAAPTAPGLGAGAGEQVGPVLQRPGQSAPLPGLWCGRGRRRGDQPRPTVVGSTCATTSTMSGVGSRPSSGGHCAHLGSSVAVAAADSSQLPAGRARLARAGRRPRSTSPRRGVAACAAVCRTRRRPAPRSSLRRPCAARSAGPRPRAGAGERPSASTAGRSQQGLGQPAALGAAAGHALDDPA